MIISEGRLISITNLVQCLLHRQPITSLSGADHKTSLLCSKVTETHEILDFGSLNQQCQKKVLELILKQGRFLDTHFYFILVKRTKANWFSAKQGH